MGGEEEAGLDAGEVAAADAGGGDDPDAAAKAAAALKIQRIGRGKMVRQQDRQALAASSTVTKAEAREERQRQISRDNLNLAHKMIRIQERVAKPDRISLGGTMNE